MSNNDNSMDDVIYKWGMYFKSHPDEYDKIMNKLKIKEAEAEKEWKKKNGIAD